MQEMMIEQCAEALRQAQATGKAIAPLTAGPTAPTMADAYEIQMVNVRKRLAAGAHVVGKKQSDAAVSWGFGTGLRALVR
jgi:2-keto-4-pentenoate hydratase